MEKFIIIPEGDSSSSILADMFTQGEVGNGDTLMVVNQTEGRGQRGNSWEAEAGQNVTMSMLLVHEGLHAIDQFLVSQLISLAIIDMLRQKLGEVVAPERVCVKWPNDIYVDNLKIAGILIESTITGELIDRSIIGIGLNVNQIEFLSDAPNPVSMAQLLGRLYEKGPEHLGRELSRRIMEYVHSYRSGSLNPEEIRGRYKGILWRRQGFHPYTDVATNELFNAAIGEIESTGHLHLHTEGGEDRRYAFKEVVFEEEC